MNSDPQSYLHANGSAGWDISDEVLGFIRTHVQPGDTTLETGAGASTLTFLAAGAHHHTVTPSKSECDLIAREASRRGLDANLLTVHEGYSQDVLPRLELGTPLDMVLIDGGHGFPIPAVDWVYTAPHLKVGGIMLFDDVDLWTGGMLVEFLKAEPGWEMLDLIRGRTAAFRMTAPFSLHEWTRQPHVVRKSKWTQRSRKAKNLAGLLAKGDFSSIKAKVANEKRLAEAAKEDY